MDSLPRIFTLKQTRLCVFSLDEYRDRIGTDAHTGHEVSEDEIRFDLDHDNGQFAHLLGEMFGWQCADVTHHVHTDGNYREQVRAVA